MLKRIAFFLFSAFVLILVISNGNFVYGQNDKEFIDSLRLVRGIEQYPTHGTNSERYKVEIKEKDNLPKLIKSKLSQLDNFPINSSSLEIKSLSGEVLDNRGKDFWICFQQNYDDIGVSLKLFITSDFNTTCIVSIPHLNWEQTFDVIAREITTVELPYPEAIIISSSEVIENKGVHVQAEDEIAIYGLNRREYSTDAFLALPVDILNLFYFVVSHQSLDDYYNQSQFAIVSPYDDVQVEITPSVNTEGGNIARQTFSITLNKGQIYQVQAYNGLDLTGSVIQASLPVAVFSGHSCANVPLGYGYCDHLVEQLPPVNTWGNSFITVPLAGRENGDTFRMLASQDNTAITINGIYIITINFGDYYETILNVPTQITSSKPILVMQYSNGNDWDPYISDNGDPFMMLIPPSEQFMSSYSFSTPSSGFPTNYLNLTITTEGISSLLLDGGSIDFGLFKVISGTEFSCASIPISIGSHQIENTEGIPFGIYSYGFWDCDSYGYAGGLSLEYIYGGSAPTIVLTTETIGIINQAQVEGNALIISAVISDSEEPFTQSAILFYKKVTDLEFTQILMSNISGDTWTAAIPANDVVTPGLKFYIYATDGQLSSTNPIISPIQYAHNIAVLPNQLPDIEHDIIKRTTLGSDILIAATITDETYQVSVAELFYRKPGGNPSYTRLEMTLNGTNSYVATIPGNEVTTEGIEYFIKATDDFDLCSYHGTVDNPHKIIVTDILPIIFIPGIMGSPLFHDINDDNSLYRDTWWNYSTDEYIWADAVQISDFVYDYFLDVLQLKDDGITPLLENDYKIKVAPLRNDNMETIEELLEIKPLESYKNLIYALRDDENYKLDNFDDFHNEDENLYVFTYDWRKSISASALELKNLIENIKTWNNTDKVNLVCHSMGGLVAKRVIDESTKTSINKIIFIATPHQGAPKILSTMATGEVFGWADLVFNNNEVRKISRNMPSVYHLMPSSIYTDTTVNNGENTEKLSLYEYAFRFPNDINATYLQMISFYDSISLSGNFTFNTSLNAEGHSERQLIDNVDFGDIEVFNIVGFNDRTIGLVEYFLVGKFKETWNLTGDGTVPLRSAEIVNLSKTKADFYIKNEKHENLPSSEAGVEIVKGLLKEPAITQISMPNKIYYEPPESYALSTWQAMVSCPVSLHAYDSQGNHTGSTSDTTWETNIPYSEYFLGDLRDPHSPKRILLSPDDDEYYLKIISLDTSGSFDLYIDKIIDGYLQVMVYFDSIVVQNQTNAICDLTFDQNFELKMDYNGDGTIDSIITPSIVGNIENDNRSNSLPAYYHLDYNYPNPFNPTTKINYALPKSAFVELKVYNILGQEIATLVNADKPAGYHEVNFNASNIPSGIYFYRLQAGDFVQTRKMILLK
jgi:hypothetical protein